MHKACFAHDATYFDSEDLAKITIFDAISKDRAYKIAKNRQCDGYQRGLAIMVYRFFDKKTESRAIATIKARASVNEQLAEELHKPAAEKFKRTKVYMRFKDNIWIADLAEKKSLS